MKKLLGMSLAFGLAAAAFAAEDRVRIYSNPVPPSREVLERLNLVQAWRTYVPTDGRRDGLISVQMSGGQLLVQTRAGVVALLDAETGRVAWRAQVGFPYRTAKPLAFNSKAIFAISGTDLFALDRATGRPQWEMRLPEAVSAPPLADEDVLYLCGVTSKIYAYLIPRPESIPAPSTRPGEQPKPTPPPPSGEGALYGRGAGAPSLLSSPVLSATQAKSPAWEPDLVWSTIASVRVELMPLQTAEVLMLPSPPGTVAGLGKEKGSELYRFATDGPLAASAGQYGEEAYLGSEDTNLYALNMTSGRPRWRYPAGAAIFQQPRVTEEDVYVVADRKGMIRVRRDTGDGLWSNAVADRFLAANPKFVYALDRSRRLLVIDRARGRTLSQYDTSDFVFPVPNEQTDRLYLAAHNGLIVCLHDRDFAKPYQQRKSEERLGEAPVPGPGDVEKAAALKKRLTEPVTEAGAEPKPLRDVLADLGKRYGLKFFLAERAFKEAAVEPIEDKLVAIPKGDKVPLGTLLQQTLDPVEATYQVIADTIQIVPKPPKKP
jgi:outer membrane protein assembly factor BamB